MESGNLIRMSIPIIPVSWMPLGCDDAPPLRCMADRRSGSSCVTSVGGLIHPVLRCAHDPQVFRVLAIIHPPSIVLAVSQGPLWAVAPYVIHPYWSLWNNKFTTSLLRIVQCIGNASTQQLKSVAKCLTPDFYGQADLCLSCVFSRRYSMLHKSARCCRSCSLNLFNLRFNLDLKAAVKNVHKPPASVAQLWQANAVIILKQTPPFFCWYSCTPGLPVDLNKT